MLYFFPKICDQVGVFTGVIIPFQKMPTFAGLAFGFANRFSFQDIGVCPVVNTFISDSIVSMLIGVLLLCSFQITRIKTTAAAMASQ